MINIYTDKNNYYINEVFSLYLDFDNSNISYDDLDTYIYNKDASIHSKIIDCDLLSNNLYKCNITIDYVGNYSIQAKGKSLKRPNASLISAIIPTSEIISCVAFKSLLLKGFLIFFVSNTFSPFFVSLSPYSSASKIISALAILLRFLEVRAVIPPPRVPPKARAIIICPVP